MTGLCGMMALSAVVTKELMGTSATLEPLAGVRVQAAGMTGETASVRPVIDDAQAPLAPVVDPLAVMPTVEEVAADELAASDAAASQTVVEPTPAYVDDVNVRFFNGRPVRPVRTIRMKVTAYSPDERSCAGTADGITSSNHDVFTNAMRMAAADSRVLPLGSIISVPGYDDGRVIPVLDRGGAIKGRRLDVLYPTHEQARRWGVKHVDVVVWEYADGLPASDYRKVRDSKER